MNGDNVPKCAIIPLSSLVEASAAEIAMYGGKIAGDVSLRQALPESPVAYRVPQGFGVKPRCHGGDLSRVALRASFDALISGAARRGVLMARSSSLTERPGHNPTIEAVFDQTDPETSFRRFQSASEQVFETRKDMGVLLTRMVGEETRFDDGTPAFGWTNRSFVTDSHSPFNHKEMLMSAVHGTGHQVVDTNSEYVAIIALRESGMVLTVINRTREASMAHGGSVTFCKDIEEYAQKQGTFVDLRTGKVHKRDLSQADVDRSHPFCLTSPTGPTPLKDIEHIQSVFSTLRYLSARYGSIQIEGTMLDSEGDAPFIYQLLKYPAEQHSTQPVSITDPHLTSETVIGKGKFSGPLIFFNIKEKTRGVPTFEERTLLWDIDSQHSTRGYVLVTDLHSKDIMSATPNARVRISLGNENPLSHVATDTRRENMLNRKKAPILVVQPQVTADAPEELKRLFESPRSDTSFVFDEVMFEANGQEMALRVTRKSRPWWRPFWPLF